MYLTPSLLYRHTSFIPLPLPFDPSQSLPPPLSLCVPSVLPSFYKVTHSWMVRPALLRSLPIHGWSGQPSSDLFPFMDGQASPPQISSHSWMVRPALLRSLPIHGWSGQPSSDLFPFMDGQASPPQISSQIPLGGLLFHGWSGQPSSDLFPFMDGQASPPQISSHSWMVRPALLRSLPKFPSEVCSFPSSSTTLVCLLFLAVFLPHSLYMHCQSHSVFKCFPL